MTSQQPPPRSMLFVPGSRPELFDKAAHSGADAICLDLEDGVLPAAKIEARDCIGRHLASAANATSGNTTGSATDCAIAVRINSPRTRAGLADLLALSHLATAPALVVIPKVESAAELDVVRSAFAEGRQAPVALVALIESLRGIQAAHEIALARDVVVIGIGTADLAAEMGIAMDWEPLLLARLQLVQAAKAAQIQAIDGAWLQLDDAVGLESESRRSAALGFTAKICVHPKQIQVVHAAFGPTQSELDEARATIAAFENAVQGAVRAGGRMVDLPVVEAARRTLARARSR